MVREIPWPVGPDPEATAGLTAPTRSYVWRARWAVAGLFTVLGVYFGLTVWFGYVAWSRFSSLYHGVGDGFWDFVVGAPAAFLFLVMMKGLFFVRRGATDRDEMAVTAEEEPTLFAFVHRLADEAGSPRPKRIYLTPGVNAAVAYDLSWLSVLFPTRKRLLLGLGLVNSLTLDELKAVVAHELGHFAQRTMRIGAWVYLTQQFVADLITRRDAFDRALDGLSRFDLRVAWIGWLLRLYVWSIRSVLQVAFRVVIPLERALSREMELQADLVSVSLAGSDSIVHALYRLRAADDGFDRALRLALGQAASGHPPDDLYAIQSEVIAGVRTVLQDPQYGRTPNLPPAERERTRVFTRDLAEAPRMWASHPPNAEREENAKRRYLPSTLDEREAWVLFSDPAALRRKVTRSTLAATLQREVGECSPPEATLAAVQAMFQRPHLASRFRGVWVDRALTRHAKSAEQLTSADLPSERGRILAALDALYPDSLRALVKRCDELGRERLMVRGLMDGFLQAPGGVIRFRGETLRKRDLPRVLASVEEQLGAATAALHAHDRDVRASHLAAARSLGGGWEEYLRSLIALQHYAEHAEADVDDAHGHLQNAIGMALADSNVSAAEHRRIVKAACEVHDANRSAFGLRDRVVLPDALRASLNDAAWADILGGPYTLPEPDAQNLGEWLGAIDSWTGAASRALGVLARANLDVLVAAEAQVERAFREGADPGPAPAPARVPAKYPLRLDGDERPRIKRLTWWDKFVLADGWVAATARLVLALAVLLPGLYLSSL